MDAAPYEGPTLGDSAQRESSRRLRLCVVSAVMTVIVVGCFLMLGFSLKRNEELVAVLDRYREHLNQMGSTARHSSGTSKDSQHAKRAVQRSDDGTRPDGPQVVYIEGPTPSNDDIPPMGVPRPTRLSRLRLAEQLQEGEDIADSEVLRWLPSANGSFSNESVQLSLDTENLTDILFSVNASGTNNAAGEATVVKEDVRANGTAFGSAGLNGSEAQSSSEEVVSSAPGSTALNGSKSTCENATCARTDTSVTEPSRTASVSTREKHPRPNGPRASLTTVGSGWWNRTVSETSTSDSVNTVVSAEKKAAV